MDRKESILNTIRQITDKVNQLSFAEADLLYSDVWKILIRGVDNVRHIASPFSYYGIVCGISSLKILFELFGRHAWS